jgi:transposase
MVSIKPGTRQLTCWAGLTPKHHESDTHVHRGRITKQGSRLVRWAAIESVKTISATTPAGVLRERVADRRGPLPAGVRLLRPARRSRVRLRTPAEGGMNTIPGLSLAGAGRGRS